MKFCKKIFEDLSKRNGQRNHLQIFHDIPIICAHQISDVVTYEFHKFLT